MLIPWNYNIVYNMVYFNQSMHMSACQLCLTTDLCNNFVMDKALRRIGQTGYGQFVKMPITHNHMVY